MTKSDSILAALRNRLAQGDYAVRPFPAERDLASEFAVSYMTARKVVAQLMREGLLVRSGRGRATPAAQGEAGRPILSLLAYGWPARAFVRLPQLLLTAASACDLACSHQRFTHWDDPVVNHTLARSRGVLILPPADDVPAAVVERLVHSGCKTAVIGTDLSSHGLMSIDHLPATAVRTALDHLSERGHRRLAVVNVQPHDHAIRARLAEVQVWARAHGPVELIDQPVTHGTDPLEPACAAAARLFASQQRATGVLGLTLHAALGAQRAAADRGIRVGPDFALAALDGENLAAHLVPSLTTVDSTGLPEAIANAAAWMSGAINDPPLLVRCAVTLHVRESTAERASGERHQSRATKHSRPLRAD